MEIVISSRQNDFFVVVGFIFNDFYLKSLNSSQIGTNSEGYFLKLTIVLLQFLVLSCCNPLKHITVWKLLHVYKSFEKIHNLSEGKNCDKYFNSPYGLLQACPWWPFKRNWVYFNANKEFHLYLKPFLFYFKKLL